MTPLSPFISNKVLLGTLLAIGLATPRMALADQNADQSILLAQASSGGLIVDCSRFPELPPCKSKSTNPAKPQNDARPEKRAAPQERPQPKTQPRPQEKSQPRNPAKPQERAKPQPNTPQPNAVEKLLTPRARDLLRQAEERKNRQQQGNTDRKPPRAERDRPRERPAERPRQRPDDRNKAKPKPDRETPRAERPRRDRPDTSRPGAERRPDARPRPRPGDRKDDARRKDRRRDDRPRADRRRERPRPDRGGELEFSLPIPGLDGRVIIRKDGDITVRSRDDERFGRDRSDRTVQRLSNGRTRVVVRRPNGVSVITVRDSDGEIVRRIRRMPDGREFVLIDNTRARRDHRPLDFRPLYLDIPRDRYIVEGEIGRRPQVKEALRARPVEPVERPYSLSEIRRNERLRAKMRRVDLSLTFAFNSAAIPATQYDRLEVIGDTIADEIRDNPSDVFLIEGHTDAPGSYDYNLRLSDARAESVAIALTEYFGIPPENLVTQGYGEAYLKIDTLEREPLNRRVTVRRITPLLDGGR